MARQDRHEDDSRRHARRGVARAVLEAEARGDEGYFETHPIAADFRAVTPRTRLTRWASEQNPTTSTGVQVVGVGCAGCEGHGRHAWPCDR